MNCNDCRRWIATAPLDAVPMQVRAAVQQHAAGCAACAAELDATRAFELRLATMASPQIPSTLEDVIMRAVLQSDEARTLTTRAAEAAPASATAASDAWALRALGLGTALAVLTQCLALFGGDAAFNLFAPLVQGGFDGLMRMPQHGGVAIGVASGAVLLLAGLFASVLQPVWQSSRDGIGNA